MKYQRWVRRRLCWGGVAWAAVVFVCVPAATTGGTIAEAILQATGEQAPPGIVPPIHLEAPDGFYIAVPPDQRRTSPAFRAVANGFESVQVNVDDNGDNIVGDAASEPSIAVDPRNSMRMAIGWRQFDTFEEGFRQAGWGYTRDGGRSWTFPGVIEPGAFRSDPVLGTDADGTFYYLSYLIEDRRDCYLFRSFDGGATWDDGVFAYGGDKPWMAIDRTNGIGRGNIYSYSRGCRESEDGRLTRSYDGGDSFLPCVTIPRNPRFGTMSVGPDGEVYLIGEDGPKTFPFPVAKSTTLQDPKLPPSFSLSFVDLGGGMNLFGLCNSGGLNGQAWIATDHSEGETRGNVYVLSSVYQMDTGDPLDVMFARSTDGGRTWSDPVRVNDDAPGSVIQWFGTMSVAPNGRIDAIWNDPRNDPDRACLSEVFYSFSEDAGDTWSPNVAISPPFEPLVNSPDGKIGDYYHMVSDRVGAHLAYAATFNGEQDIYYLRIGDYDCNDNGIGDNQDIAGGTSEDINGNGIPDECECLGDLDESGVADFGDLLRILAAWGECPNQSGCPEDLDDDGTVGFSDILILLAAWGPCV